MNKSITIGFIPGVMFGIEWDYIFGIVCIDLLLVRIIWDYVGTTIVEYNPQEFEAAVAEFEHQHSLDQQASVSPLPDSTIPVETVVSKDQVSPETHSTPSVH